MIDWKKIGIGALVVIGGIVLAAGAYMWYTILSAFNFDLHG